MRLFRSSITETSIEKRFAVDPLDGAELFICLVDPVCDTGTVDDGVGKGTGVARSAFHVNVYALQPHERHPPSLLKLALQFDSEAETMLRLLLVCFQERSGARLLAGLSQSPTLSTIPAAVAVSQPSIYFEQFIDASHDDLTEKLRTAINSEVFSNENEPAPWQSVLYAVGSALSSLLSSQGSPLTDFRLAAGRAVAIVSPAVQFLADMGDSIPFFGAIATALDSIFHACLLVKARGNAVAKFVVLVCECTLLLMDSLGQRMVSLAKESAQAWHLKGDDDLLQLLQRIFKLVYRLTTQGAITKFLETDDVIGQLVESGWKLHKCLAAFTKAMELNVAVLRLKSLEGRLEQAGVRWDEGDFVFNALMVTHSGSAEYTVRVRVVGDTPGVLRCAKCANSRVHVCSCFTGIFSVIHL